MGVSACANPRVYTRQKCVRRWPSGPLLSAMRVSAESRPPPSVLGTRGQAEPSRALGRAPGCSWTSAQWEPRPRSASGASALSRGRHRRRDGVTAGCTSSPSAARAAVRSGELAATSASVCLSSAGVWPARPASPRGTGGATAPAALGAARGADRGAGPAAGAAPSPLPSLPRPPALAPLAAAGPGADTAF